LLMMGLRSSRIHLVDVKDDPRKPRIAKIIEPEEYKAKSGYSRPHTAPCGPEAIYITNLGAAEGDEGPGGIARLDRGTCAGKRTWEKARAPRYPPYASWWHIDRDRLIAGEWGAPRQIENGAAVEDPLAGKYGNKGHGFALATRKHLQALELGDQ